MSSLRSSQFDYGAFVVEEGTATVAEAEENLHKMVREVHAMEVQTYGLLSRRAVLSKMSALLAEEEKIIKKACEDERANLASSDPDSNAQLHADTHKQLKETQRKVVEIVRLLTYETLWMRGRYAKFRNGREKTAPQVLLANTQAGDVLPILSRKIESGLDMLGQDGMDNIRLSEVFDVLAIESITAGKRATQAASDLSLPRSMRAMSAESGEWLSSTSDVSGASTAGSSGGRSSRSARSLLPARPVRPVAAPRKSLHHTIPRDKKRPIHRERGAMRVYNAFDPFTYFGIDESLNDVVHVVDSDCEGVGSGQIYVFTSYVCFGGVDVESAHAIVLPIEDILFVKKVSSTSLLGTKPIEVMRKDGREYYFVPSRSLLDKALRCITGQARAQGYEVDITRMPELADLSRQHMLALEAY